MPIVYCHKIKDSNQVFYVGIGKEISRAYEIDNRNKYWHHIVDKYGYEIEITHTDVIWEEACSIEKYLISFYGRKDLNEGPLVNMTDGGDGIPNPSPESKKKISDSKIGDKNPTKRKEVKEKLRKAWTEERKKTQGAQHRQYMLSNSKTLSQRMTGSNNPFFGKEPPNKNKKYKQDIVICPFCKKFGGIGNMKRWHFNNCKSKEK